jgi:hypothetical protein
VIVIETSAGENHGEDCGLHRRGEEAQDESDLHAPFVTSSGLMAPLPRYTSIAEQPAGGRETSRAGARDTTAGATIRGTEQRDQTSGEGRADDRRRRHLEREARVLALFVT